jgi:flagellar biosynthesis protein FliQ
MTADVAVDLFREALALVILLVCVLIVPSLLVGLVISMFQAATQINEQTLSFLPRLLMTLGMMIFAGPWIIGKLVDFNSSLAARIPGLLG